MAAGDHDPAAGVAFGQCPDPDASLANHILVPLGDLAWPDRECLPKFSRVWAERWFEMEDIIKPFRTYAIE